MVVSCILMKCLMIERWVGSPNYGSHLKGGKFSEGGHIQAMFCPNLVHFHAHLLGQNHDTMVISRVSTNCSMIERWGGVQMMGHTERVARFLRGDTYKLCSVQIWLISMHIYLAKIIIQ